MSFRQISFLLSLCFSLNSLALYKKYQNGEISQSEFEQATAMMDAGDDAYALNNQEKVDISDDLRNALSGPIKRKVKKTCFTEGTLVLSDEGCTPIEEISMGDQVLSYNLTSTELQKSNVEDVMEFWTDVLILLEFSNGRVVETTENHPFYLENLKEWMEAARLEVGDTVRGVDFSSFVSGISRIRLAEPIQVFDISIQGTHNYFVLGYGKCTELDAALLVHNCNEVKEFGQGVAVGASESLPGASQHPPQGSDTFEAGRATGQILTGAAEVGGGTAGVAGGIVLGEAGVVIGCPLTGCLATPVAVEAGAAVAAGGAALASHGASQIAQGVQKLFKEGEEGASGSGSNSNSPSRSNGPVFKTTKEASSKAKELGFEKIKERVNGQSVYRKGKEYITRDVDGHNGGAWKKAKSVKDLAKKETRSGTYDANLNRIGD